MIEPMIQNKNRYNFPNMYTCMILDSPLNKSLYTHQSRECCIHEDNW